LILYNAKEANDWIREYGLQSGGLWEQILLEVGLSLRVLENLQTILESGESNVNAASLVADLSGIGFIRPDCSASHKCSCNSKDSDHTIDENMIIKRRWAAILNESLLYLHWNIGRDNSRQRKCLVCVGNHLIESDKARPHRLIPFVSLFRALTSNCSSNNIAIVGANSLTATKAATVLDFVLGILVGITFLISYDQIRNTIFIVWESHQLVWQQGLIWLLSNPFGVKMNRALTEQAILIVQSTLQHHEQVLLGVVSPCATVMIRSLGMLTIVFGSRFFFALSFDVLRLAFLHITILSKLFSKCLQLELSTLSSLWLLFRGKKRNVLRLRSDHLHYDHMQLLLGMLLFSMCIFLFTTVAMHHWFFSVMAAVWELVLCGVWLGYMGVESLFHIDKLLRNGHRNCGHAKLLNVSSDEGIIVMSGISKTLIEEYFNGSSPLNGATTEATITSGFTLKSTAAVISRLSFSVTSDTDIVIGSLVSFHSSRLTKMIVFLPRIVVASTCQIVRCCMNTTRSMRQEASSE
jgi:hypothetical protein